MSGAARALLVDAEGAVMAAAGAPLRGASDAELARAAGKPGAAVKGAPFFAATPVLDASGARLGVLAVASGSALAAPPRLNESLQSVAGLCAEALADDDGLAASERYALVAEIDHRVRNVLSAVQSMASQSARRAGSLDGFLKAFSGRLKAMASAHELLTATRGRGWR